jgi:NAD(P)-dependent dehydrogenase (short-subunit alcohol dehydrogenase family)
MKSVIVTGAAGGIGKAVCEVFLRDGYKVIGVDSREIPCLNYEVMQFDISRLRNVDPECKEFYAKVESLTEGRLDVLVNNAAVQIVKPVESITACDWDVTLDTNLLAPFWLTQRFLPMLRAARGSVVNVSSIHAALTKKEFTVYSTSKGALVSLTRALALELAPDVRVNAILPAATDTQMLRDGFKEDLKGLEELGSYHPLGRIAKPEEIAEVAIFLAARSSGFMTGAVLNVDGGLGGYLHDPVKAK